MTITIYITLIVLVIISGLYAVSPYETTDKTKTEGTTLEQMGFFKGTEAKKHIYSKFISLTVFVLSLASLMAMYFIKV